MSHADFDVVTGPSMPRRPAPQPQRPNRPADSPPPPAAPDSAEDKVRGP